MRIETVAAAPVATRRARKTSPGFVIAVDEERDPGAPSAAAPTAVASPVAAATIISSAATHATDPQADLRAVRQGHALLGALAGVQLAGLTGGGEGARQVLAELAGALPQASDPRLEAILQAIAQRASIELARSE